MKEQSKLQRLVSETQLRPIPRDVGAAGCVSMIEDATHKVKADLAPLRTVALLGIQPLLLHVLTRQRQEKKKSR